MAMYTVLALWVLALSRLPQALRGGNAVFNAVLPAAVAATVNLAPIRSAIDQAVDLPRASLLIQGTLLIVAFGLFRNAIVQAVASPSARESNLRRGMLQTCVVATVYIVAFLCAAMVGALGTPREQGTALGHDGIYVTDSGVFVFATALCGFLASVTIDVALTCRRYLPRMTSSLYRLGFGGVAAGCIVGFLALITAEVQQVMILLSAQSRVLDGLDRIVDQLAGIASLLITVGLILPSMSRRARDLNLGQRWRLIQLHPLWRRASTLRPDLVLDPRAVPARGAFAPDPRRHLHRTLVEILDCDFSAGGRLLTRRQLRILSKAEEALND